MTENEQIRIGNKIRKVFDDAGLNQQDVSEIIHVTQSVISKWLNGKPFGKNASKKWEEAFGFRQNWLLTGEGDMFTSSHPKVYEYKGKGNNYGDVSSVDGVAAGIVNGQVVNIPNFNGEKIISPDGKVELCGSAQSKIEKLEIENKYLNQRIADLDNIINMKDKLILMLEEKLKFTAESKE